MNDLTLSNKKDLVAQIHNGSGELPLPFERDILLLAVELADTEKMPGIQELYDLIEIGERVRLIREPNNEADPFAIRVEIMNNDLQELLDGKCAMGYVPRAHNRPFARLMDAGKYLYGVICHKEIRENRHRIVMNIIMKDDVYVRVETSVHAEAMKKKEPAKKEKNRPDAPRKPQKVVPGEEVNFELEESKEGGYIIKSFVGFDTAEMIVPNEIGGKKIVGIGPGAYRKCLNMQSLVISEGIKFIEQSAFANCVRIQKVELPASLIRIGSREKADSDKSGAFEGTAINTIRLPKQLKNLGFRTFRDCDSLTEIDIPDGVTVIPAKCFEFCGELKKVSFPMKLYEIDTLAFHECAQLDHISLPMSCRNIGDGAFKSCEELSDLRLNDGIQIIYQEAFADCTKLKNVRLPRSLLKIANEAFGPYGYPRSDLVIECYPGTVGLKFARKYSFTMREAGD